MDRISFKINGKTFTVGNDVDPNVTLLEIIRGRAGLKSTKIMCNEGGYGVCILSVVAVGNDVNPNVTLLEIIRGRAGLKSTKIMCNEGGYGVCILSVVAVGNDVNPNVTLLEIIRGRAGLKGTKVMCNEGGCGVCIVSVVVSPNETPIAVNSCMVSALSCQNWEITTIEGIGNRNKGYHPIQKALAKNNGSQCGHCSPGWVMAMYSLMASTKSLTMLEIENSFASNVCRCTGYRPILKAFKMFGDDAPKHTDIDIEDLKLCKQSGKNCAKTECGLNDWCFVTEKDIESQMKIITLNDGKIWFRVNTVREIFDILRKEGVDSYMLVAGNTAKGIYPIEDYPRVLIDISGISEIRGYLLDQNLVIGAGTTLSELMRIFEEVSGREYFEYLKVMNNHLKWVANIPVKNLGTIGGNLILKYAHSDFRSDVFILFATVDARLTIMFNEKVKKAVTMQEFLKLDMTGKVIVNVMLPPLTRNHKIVTYKIMPKSQNALAVVHCGFLYNYNDIDSVVKSARIVYGGISPTVTRAYALEAHLAGKILFQNSTLQSALAVLDKELEVTENPPQLDPVYRKKLAISLFYKSLLSLCPINILSPRFRSGAIKLNENRPLSQGCQDYPTNPSLYPLNQPLPKLEALAQCSGEALYTDDEVQPLANEVHAAFVLSTVPKGIIVSLDPTPALKETGVIAFYSAKDIPGLNSFMDIDDPINIANEEVLSSGKVNYYNQPIGLIVADTQYIANKASKLVIVRYSNTDKPVINIKEAKTDPRRSQLFQKITAQKRGNDISKIIKGGYTLRGQYHFPLETLTCFTRPSEDGFEVNSTSQAADAVQTMVSRALNINQNRVYVQVRRLGGGFGFKISRNTQVAVACSLVSFKLNRPCRFVTPLSVNTRAFGKRMPNSTDYEVAVNSSGVIQYLNLNIYEDNGFMINEKLAMYFAANFDNCYNGSLWNYNVYNTITDTAKNTWLRAPGTLESVAVAETLMEHISYDMVLDPIDVRIRNLDPSTAKNNIEMLNELKINSDYNKRKSGITKFNIENRWKKRGLRYSFLRWSHNYGRYFDVNIAVYHGDGSLTITHGGIEIGQGINTRAAQICAYVLNIPLSKINVSASNTLGAPNSAVTGGSITTQFICASVKNCCTQLLDRLLPVRKVLGKNATWEEVIKKAYEMGIDLQAHGFVGSQTVLDYFVYGVSLTEVEIDVLTGEHQILRVDILQDVGESINPELDVGQVEGAFVMGLGYWTTENLIYDNTTGQLLTDTSRNYFVPQAKDIPQDLRVHLRKTSHSSPIIFGSKAVGEPPMCLAISIPFAIREAITSARVESGMSSKQWFEIDGPYTVDKICLATNTNIRDFKFI